MRRPSLPRIFRFALLTTFIVCSYVVVASSSLAAVPVVTDADGALLTPAGCKGSLLLLAPSTAPDAVSHDDTIASPLKQR